MSRSVTFPKMPPISSATPHREGASVKTFLDHAINRPTNVTSDSPMKNAFLPCPQAESRTGIRPIDNLEPSGNHIHRLRQKRRPRDDLRKLLQIVRTRHQGVVRDDPPLRELVEHVGRQCDGSEEFHRSSPRRRGAASATRSPHHTGRTRLWPSATGGASSAGIAAGRCGRLWRRARCRRMRT